MSQPGAPSRLTAVYRYVLQTARDRLSGHAARLAICPACEHDDGAAARALDTLVEGLTDDQVRDRYRELGGLCIPHLRTTSARGSYRVAAWLSQTMTAAVSACRASPDWLAGIDHDAEMRAVLRRAAPAIAPPGSGACVACLAVGRSENDRLAEVLRTSDRDQPDRQLVLCGGHLNDLIALSGQWDTGPLLAWQAGCLAASLTRRPAASPVPAGWLPRSLRRRPGGPASCPICLVAAKAAQRTVDDLRASLRASHLAAGRRVPPVRAAPAGPESTRSMGRARDGRRRGGARGHADRRAGRGVQQEHLGAPPRTPGTGDDRMAAGGRVPRRRRLLRMPTARNLTIT